MVAGVSVARRCRELARAVDEADLAGKKLPKEAFEGVVVEAFEVSWETARTYVKTGRSMRLWRASDARQGPGIIIVEPFGEALNGGADAGANGDAAVDGA